MAPLSTDHKRKISQGMKKYHRKCRQNPNVSKKEKKKRVLPDPKTLPQDRGRRLAAATLNNRGLRREGALKGMALARMIRGRY